MSSENSHLFQEFQKTVKAFPSNIAIIHRREKAADEITYQKLYDQSLQLAAFLKEKYSIQKGDRVCLFFDTEPQYAVAFWAVLALDSIVVPLDVQYSNEMIQGCFKHASAKIFLTTQKYYDRLRTVLPEGQMIICDRPDVFKSGTHFSRSDSSQHNQLAVFFYTSGTTDQPKAVMLSHENILSNIRAVKDLKIVSEKDVILAMLPLHHAYALTVTMLAPLLAGARVVFPASTNSQDILNAMRENKVTIFVGVPQIFSLMHRSIQNKMKAFAPSKRWIIFVGGNCLAGVRSLLRVNLSKNFFKEVHKNLGTDLRFMVSGGAKLDTDVAKDFSKWGFTILEGYGLTETSPVAAFNPYHRPKIGSVGKPLPGVQIKIDQPNDKAIGEVLIKGPNVMQGYYKLDDLTREILKDGWFYSGDLGYIDSDGYVFLTGRKKELIVLSSGKNINPEEVEKFYSGIPLIKELAVLPIKTPGFVRGVEQLGAIVVVDEEYVKSRKEINLYERLKWELENVSVKLPTYQRITGFAIAKNPIPRTRLGKIMRYQLNDIYTALIQTKKQATPAVSVDLEIDPSDIAQSTLKSLSQIFGREVRLQDHLELDLGLDSLSRIELLLNLQERVKLKLSEDQAAEFFASNTVEDLLKKLESLMLKTNLNQTQGSSDLTWKGFLNEPPSAETVKKIKIHFGVLSVLFNIFFFAFFKMIARLFYSLKVEGLEKLPAAGPYLICPNHTSFLDGFFIACALPYKIILQTYFLGGSVFFENFIVKPFLRVGRLIPIEMSHNLQEALRACSYVLAQNKIMCIFPEGQRSIDGKVGFFKKGAGILIKELDVKVIPVYIEGSFEAWPRNQRFPKLHPVKVIFGNPIGLKELQANSSKAGDIYREIALSLQGKVKELGDRL